MSSVAHNLIGLRINENIHQELELPCLSLWVLGSSRPLNVNPHCSLSTHSVVSKYYFSSKLMLLTKIVEHNRCYFILSLFYTFFSCCCCYSYRCCYSWCRHEARACDADEKVMQRVRRIIKFQYVWTTEAFHNIIETNNSVAHILFVSFTCSAKMKTELAVCCVCLLFST